MNRFKNLLPDIVVIAIFAIISFAYFYPADIEGRVLAQHSPVEEKSYQQMLRCWGKRFEE